MVGRPKGPVKKVFSFRADPSAVDMWRAYATVTGMSVDDLGKRAMELYLAQNPLTDEEQARLELLTNLKACEAIRQWPLIINRGGPDEKIYFASEAERQDAMRAYKEQGARIVMVGAVELTIKGGGEDDEG